LEITHVKFYDNLVTVGNKKKGNVKDYVFDAGLFYLPTGLVPVDLPATRAACKLCKNYNNNGGCPPYTGELSKMVSRYPYMYTFYILFHIYDGPIGALVNEEKKKRVRRWVMVVKWWDFVFSPLIRRVIVPVANSIPEIKTQVLYYGNCRMCGSTPCAYKTGENKCRHPERREFSMESVGIRVDWLMQLIGVETQWFLKKQGKHGILPRWANHLYKATAILSQEELDVDELAQKIQQLLRQQRNRK